MLLVCLCECVCVWLRIPERNDRNTSSTQHILADVRILLRNRKIFNCWTTHTDRYTVRIVVVGRVHFAMFAVCVIWNRGIYKVTKCQSIKCILRPHQVNGKTQKGEEEESDAKGGDGQREWERRDCIESVVLAVWERLARNWNNCIDLRMSPTQLIRQFGRLSVYVCVWVWAMWARIREQTISSRDNNSSGEQYRKLCSCCCCCWLFFLLLYFEMAQLQLGNTSCLYLCLCLYVRHCVVVFVLFFFVHLLHHSFWSNIVFFFDCCFDAKWVLLHNSHSVLVLNALLLASSMRNICSYFHFRK